jgi:hypothetical protein
VQQVHGGGPVLPVQQPHVDDRERRSRCHLELLAQTLRASHLWSSLWCLASMQAVSVSVSL